MIFLQMCPTELRDNVSQCPLNPWDNDMLDGINSSVGGFDNLSSIFYCKIELFFKVYLIQSDEGCLQRCQFDQQVDSLLIVSLQSLQLLTSLGEARKLVGISAILRNENCNRFIDGQCINLVGLKDRQVHPSNIVILRLDFNLRLVDIL